ncbi:MAG: tRNA lysidine(34) synthetase TilS [Phycisphaerae bacterium]|nr:tRNA lysidine(34) synthetase TilS [Phycisphaerae bacterium]
MAWNAFLDGLAGWLDQRQLLDKNSKWVLGASGGPDSTILAHALAGLTAARDLGWKLNVAHLHHGLRGADADADEQFVRDLASELGLPFHGERIDIAGEVARQGGSTEEVARQHRYEFLERVALKTGADRVAVGHHADDDAETILHRICRGTGLRGLAGMAAARPIRAGSRVQLIRPLLHHRRATIEKLLAQRGLKYRLDGTNLSGEHTRGRIRNQVLPMLCEQLNPNVTDALLRLGEQARWIGTYLADAAARTFESLVISETPQHLVLNARALVGKQKIIQAEVVRLVCSLIMGGEQDLGFTHIEAVLKLAGNSASGKELHLPGTVVVRKQYERLEFSSRTEREAPSELTQMFVKCPGRTNLAPIDAELVIEEALAHDVDVSALQSQAAPHEEWIDWERVSPPLFVRGRREGDRFHPLGAPGAKTLADFFIDEKIDPLERARTGILCDQVGPVWVMPLRIDERVKLRPTTKHALRLMLKPTAPPRSGV